MFTFAEHDLAALLATYGYWAVLASVAIESMGVPFPGETMLLTAAIYAGTTHRLQIGLVILAAAAGAILGDNVGFWIGRVGGYPLLRRYGRYVGLQERKVKLGQYLFLKHGGTVVFFGRFVSLLRTWAAFLAGVNCMSGGRFLAFNAAGGLVWATLYGIPAYALGNKIHSVPRPLGFLLGALGIAAVIAALVFVRRNEARLEDEAERAFPGPLAGGRPGPGRD